MAEQVLVLGRGPGTTFRALPIELDADGALKVRAYGPNGIPVSSDDITGALAVIPVVHHEVHEGSTFQASYKSPEGGDIADNAVLDILIVTNAYKWPHLTFTASAGGDAETFFYEGVTITDVGVAVPIRNMKRSSARTPNLHIYHTPVVVVGTQLRNALLPGGRKNASGGGIERENTEWILERSTNHLIRLYNRSGGAEPMGIIMQWYEESDN